MKFRSLNRKLSTSILFVTIILAIVASTVSFITELKRASDQTDIMLNQLLDTVEGTAAIAAFSRNEQIGGDVLKGLLKNDIIYEAQINADKSLNLKQSKNNAVNNEAHIKRILYSPFGDEEPIGYLSVQPTAKFKLIEAQHSAMVNALTSTLIIIITSIIFFSIIQSNISRPLARVSNTLHAIKLGRRQRIPELKRNKNDELGRLVSDINNMLEVLENKHNDEIILRKEVESIGKKLSYIFNSTSAGLFLLDEKGRVRTSNKTLEKILKISSSQHSFTNKLLSSYFEEHNQFNDLITEALQSGQLETQDFSLYLEKNSDPIWIHCLLSKTINEEGETFVEGVVFDVTKRVEAEQAISYEANHDMLTGLLRRQAAELMYQKYVNHSDTLQASFLFLDLDGFKQANDTYGHLAGDKVLVITSQRLINCVRSADIVCRLGGDEFLLVLIDCSDTDTYHIASKIISSIQQDIVVNGITINIGVSMGIAHSNDNLIDFDKLTQAADEAMYEVKRQGKNGYCVDNKEKVYKVIR
jgi:diguanylate cyclase (GGDEF)-like protein/PAS domain S-box-containing protein